MLENMVYIRSRELYNKGQNGGVKQEWVHCLKLILNELCLISAVLNHAEVQNLWKKLRINVWPT